MRLAWPATASSMALSSTSANKMMQRFFIGAADIHARPLAHRLKPFKDFNVLGGVVAEEVRVVFFGVRTSGHTLTEYLSYRLERRRRGLRP